MVIHNNSPIIKPWAQLIAGSQSTDDKIFSPSFPSTCPYVTSVGATQVSPGQSVSDPENACEQIIYSGGGFSNYFGMPDYQKAAVEGYLSAYPISYPKDIYNSTGTVHFLIVQARTRLIYFVVPRISRPFCQWSKICDCCQWYIPTCLWNIGIYACRRCYLDHGE
jgi:hypothetical protein